MTENRTSSPLEELKNLLEDLQSKKPAADLRLPSEATRRALLQLDFTPREPDLATMERHLRAIYREELADLFEKACRRLLLEDEVLAGAIYDDGSPSCRAVPLADWDREARRTLEGIPEGALEDAPLETVRLLLDRECVTLCEVARVGRGLRPLPGFGIYEGLGRMAAGDLEAARSSLGQIFHTSPFESFRWNAATNLGEAAVLANDTKASLLWYRINACCPEPWALSATLWLFYSIQSGNRAACEDASVVLGESPPPAALLADFVRRTRAQRMAGGWTPSRESTQVLTSSALRGSEEVEHVRELFV